MGLAEVEVWEARSGLLKQYGNGVHRQAQGKADGSEFRDLAFLPVRDGLFGVNF